MADNIDLSPDIVSLVRTLQQLGLTDATLKAAFELQKEQVKLEIQRQLQKERTNEGIIFLLLVMFSCMLTSSNILYYI